MKKIENIKKRTDEATRHERETVYNVESELIKIAKLHAKFFIERSHETPWYSHYWQDREERNVYVGLLGQKIFDIMLMELRVPHDRNDPTLDWRKEKDYDFQIPHIGKIEIKTFDNYCEKILIKASEWHGNDYAVIFQLEDEPPTRVRMKGWLTKEQVESLPISKKGETKYTPHEDAYITDFNKLNPSHKFFAKLETVSLR